VHEKNITKNTKYIKKPQGINPKLKYPHQGEHSYFGLTQKTSRLTYDLISVKIILLVRSALAGVVQLVECLLAKEKVVGSSPIARSGSESWAS
jgi:hypothetical protein